MIKNIEIPFEIGDAVWAVTRDVPSEDYSEYRFGKLAIYKTKIQSIKAVFYKDKNNNNKTEISYFCEGYTSYEGENWFSAIDITDSDYPNNLNYMDEAIFATKEEAKIHIKNMQRYD